MKLHNIIKENIKYYIFESLSTQRQKYGNELVDKLKDIDPTKTYKYIDFICKLYNDGISEDKIKQQIDDYNIKLNKNLIPKEYRDINKIKSYNELIDVINNKQKQESNTEIKKQYGDLNSSLAKKQYWKTITTDKGTWNIYIPQTMDESIQIASKDTTWCTQMENKSKNYFDQYRFDSNVTLYYFVNMDNKTTNLYDQGGNIINDHQKLIYQIQVYPDNQQYEIFNNNDKNITKEQLYKETGINQNDYKWKPIQNGVYNINLLGSKYKIEYKNGKMNGTCIEYSGGNIYKICNYKNGKLEGKYIKYWDGKKKSEEINYKNGKKDGIYITYYADGSISIKQTYKDDKLNGKYIKYNYDGSIDKICYYKDGKLNGKCKIYPIL